MASTAESSPLRSISIAVDLSDESAFAVKWAVQNYLRPGDAVVLLHVRPTSVLYGADWGSIPVSVDDDPDADIAEGAARAAASEEEPEEAKKKREEDFDAFTSTKAHDLAQPLVVAQIPFKIYIKDRDMKECFCLEAESLDLAVFLFFFLDDQGQSYNDAIVPRLDKGNKVQTCGTYVLIEPIDHIIQPGEVVLQGGTCFTKLKVVYELDACVFGRRLDRV